MRCGPRMWRRCPRRCRLIGEALAGRGFDGEVGQGEAVRIFTGAPVPEGADTIVIQENTEAAPGVVTVKEAAPRPPYPAARPGLHAKARCCFAPAHGSARAS